MNFQNSNDEEFRFGGNKSFAPQNLIFAITARKMLRKGVKDTWHWSGTQLQKHKSISGILVACEFSNVFSDEFTGLPPHKEIEFCI